MNLISKRLSIAGALLAMAFSSNIVSAEQTATQPRNRIRVAIDDQQVAPIAGSAHPAAKLHPDLGRVFSDTNIERATLVFKRSAQQQQDLDALLAQQQDPHSPNFHKWLTPEQFQQRFGVSASDLAAVKAWLQSHGLTVNEESSDRTLVVFSGPATQMEQAFHTEIHNYDADGKIQFANASDISVPSALANVVLGVRGLNNFRPHPRLHVKHIHSNFTSAITNHTFLTPDDFATIYNIKPLYAAGINGAGQKIAIVGQTKIDPSYIATFRSLSGLPASDPQVVTTSTPATQIVAGDIDEASLDIEWAGAVAPGATIVYVNSTNALDAIQYAISNKLAPVISSSYGDCEANLTADIPTLEPILQQAGSQGQTIVGASGDQGAADCDYSLTNTPVTTAKGGLQVDYPPSSPQVTGVGGSTLSTGSAFWSSGNDSNFGSALSYMPEVAWNDTASDNNLAASGGGASKIFGATPAFPTKPTWQTGPGVPADGVRDVPDITFSASADTDGYLVCSPPTPPTGGGALPPPDCTNGYRDSQTDLDVVGGTSAGAPAFAGVVALLNQLTATTSPNGQGNINVVLYPLATTHPDAFHDITVGDNKVPCNAGTTDCPTGGGSIGFSAGPGYDQVTGLGSINVTNLVYELAGAVPPAPVADFELGAFQTNASNTNIIFTRGATGTADTITVSALNGFSGTVNLTCSVATTLTKTTCNIAPASVNGSGTAQLTVSATALASLHGVPNHEIPGAPLWASSAFGLCALVFAGKNKAAGKAANKALLSIMLIAMVGIVGIGCGGGGGGSTPTTTTTPITPAISTPLTGMVTVTATSGALSHTVQVNVTVN